MNEYYFPFGQKLKRVEQKDRSPKKAFVLGVYASAVHARWIGDDGKNKVKALAVASEPYIFWRGEDAEKIISEIVMPPKLGRLTVPTNKNLNGASGKTLDDLFLRPLGLNREDAWLCDILPESRLNPGQQKAIKKHYTDRIIEEYGLNPVTIPHFRKSELKHEARAYEILSEIEESEAETIILLGDLPIFYFLNVFNPRYRKLSDFSKDGKGYGSSMSIMIEGKSYNILPLCHPRQAGGLGKHDPTLRDLHLKWGNNRSYSS